MSCLPQTRETRVPRLSLLLLNICIGCKAVRPLAMTPEPLAMISDDDDDCAFVEARVAEPRQTSIHLLIREGDLPVVSSCRTARAKLRREGLGWLVRRVRIVEMNPREERSALVAVQPTERGVHHLVGRPLYPGEIEVLEFPEIELIVVGSKALVEAPSAIENERSQERAGLISIL